MQYYKGITSKDGELEHRHNFKVDENGNGKTTSTSEGGHPHIHVIKNFKVLKAGPDKHPNSILKFTQIKRRIKNARN